MEEERKRKGKEKRGEREGKEGEKGSKRSLFSPCQERSTRYSGICSASGKKHRVFWDFGNPGGQKQGRR